MTFKDKKTTLERKQFILDSITEYSDRCYDKIVPIKRIMRRPDCASFQLLAPEETLTLAGSRPEGQLLQRLKVPASYIHRCPDHLQAANVNYWINQHPRQKLMLRMVKGLPVAPDAEWPAEDFCRAIFSSVYRPIDDKEVFPLAFDALEAAAAGGNLKDLHIKDWYKERDITIVRSLYQSRHVDHNDRYYWAGVIVVNSETGLSAVWIKPTIRTATATAGGFDLSDTSNEGSTRLIHTNKAAADLSQITKAVADALEAAEVGITRLIETETEMIENPARVVEEWVGASDFLSKRIIDIIKDEYKQQERATKLAVAESILRAVKDLPTFQRYLTEKETGRFLDLFHSTKARIKKIVKAREADGI